MNDTSQHNKSVTSMTVLCVDDEPNILKSLHRLLAEQGFQLLLAQSGAEALQQLANRHVDLVLSDMKMPQMSGAEFLTEVARLYPTTYRIILSGYADMASTLAAVNQGQIHRYLQKPWHQQDLLTAVHDGLDKVALQQRNTELQQQLQLRNQQLEQFNQQLEQRVEERTGLLRQLIRQSTVFAAATAAGSACNLKNFIQHHQQPAVAGWCLRAECQQISRQSGAAQWAG